MSNLSTIPVRCACPYAGERLKLFRAAITVFRFDVPSCLFLLPYLVHNVVALGGPEACRGIQQVSTSTPARAGAGAAERALYALPAATLRVCSSLAEACPGTVPATLPGRIQLNRLRAFSCKKVGIVRLAKANPHQLRPPHLLSLQELEAVLRGGASSREGGLCLQAVFSLLDVLHKWGEEAKLASTQQSGEGGGWAWVWVRFGVLGGLGGSTLAAAWVRE